MAFELEGYELEEKRIAFQGSEGGDFRISLKKSACVLRNFLKESHSKAMS